MDGETFIPGLDFGAGFLLGNLIGNFSLSDQLVARDHAAAVPNRLDPGRRPVSSMSPTMLFRDGCLWMVTGSPGSNTIPWTVAQMIVNMVDFGMNIAEATAAPRIRQDMTDGELRIEPGFSPDTLRILHEPGHKVVPGETIGSTQTLLLDRGQVDGAADPRRPGTAAVAE